MKRRIDEIIENNKRVIILDTLTELGFMTLGSLNKAHGANNLGPNGIVWYESSGEVIDLITPFKEYSSLEVKLVEAKIIRALVKKEGIELVIKSKDNTHIELEDESFKSWYVVLEFDEDVNLEELEDFLNHSDNEELSYTVNNMLGNKVEMIVFSSDRDEVPIVVYYIFNETDFSDSYEINY